MTHNIKLLYIIVIYNDISFTDQARKRKRSRPYELTIIICVVMT